MSEAGACTLSFFLLLWSGTLLILQGGFVIVQTAHKSLPTALHKVGVIVLTLTLTYTQIKHK